MKVRDLLKVNASVGAILIAVIAATMILITLISMLSGDLTETCNLGQGCSG